MKQKLDFSVLTPNELSIIHEAESKLASHCGQTVALIAYTVE